MNRIRDYRALEREFITGTMSLRGALPPPRRHRPLCGRGSGAAGRVGGEARPTRTAPARRTSSGMPTAWLPARRRSRDHALEAIDEAITKFRADLQATEKKLIDGEWVEVPAMRVTPGTWRS